MDSIERRVFRCGVGHYVTIVDYRITNFPQRERDYQPGQFFTSPEFVTPMRYGRAKWHLRLCPRADDGCYADWVSLYLNLRAFKEPPLAVSKSFSLVNAYGEEVNTNMLSRYPFELYQSEGTHTFIQREELFTASSKLIHWDKLHVRVKIITNA